VGVADWFRYLFGSKRDGSNQGRSESRKRRRGWDSGSPGGDDDRDRGPNGENYSDPTHWDSADAGGSHGGSGDSGGDGGGGDGGGGGGGGD
jgi:hypothetical protein